MELADDELADETGSSSSSDTMEPETSDSKKKVIRHSIAQRTHLEYLYKSGMNSCSKDHIALVQKAAKETGLTPDQVKVGII